MGLSSSNHCSRHENAEYNAASVTLRTRTPPFFAIDAGLSAGAVQVTNDVGTLAEYVNALAMFPCLSLQATIAKEQNRRHHLVHIVITVFGEAANKVSVAFSPREALVFLI